MIREDRFVLSHRPYAVDLNSLDIEHVTPGPMCWAYVNAVWFRRRNSITVACIGRLRDHQAWEPDDAREFLAAFTDGRYGGDCEGRWDGERYWGAQEPEVMEQHLAVLRPMLDAYPAVPDGYDGWWTFRSQR